jgi:BirA family biotin operon repressor/biotin-[acetyl-CoA-carboxylase] ligase
MKKDVSVNLFLKSFLEKYDFVYQKYLNGEITQIIKLWKDNSDTLGKNVKIIGINETYEGLAKDIDENGALILQIDNKEIKVYSGDVSLR